MSSSKHGGRVLREWRRGIGPGPWGDDEPPATEFDRATFVGATAATSSAAAAARTLALPNEAEVGQLLVARVATPSGDDPFGGAYEGAVPSIDGATLFEDGGVGLGYPWQWLFHMELADLADVTVDFTASVVNAVEFIVVGGADLADPIDVTGESTTNVIPSMTATAAEGLLLGLWVNYRSAGHTHAHYTAVPDTEIHRVPGADTLGTIMLGSSYAQIAAGATGTRTATSSVGTQRLFAHGVVINSAA